MVAATLRRYFDFGFNPEGVRLQLTHSGLKGMSMTTPRVEATLGLKLANAFGVIKTEPVRHESIAFSVERIV